MIYPASTDGERTEDPETGEPFTGNEIGWIDPRALDEDGELLSPRETPRRPAAGFETFWLAVESALPARDR
jgi:hypothetical protein